MEHLVFEKGADKNARLQEEIDLITVLIEKWDAEHNTLEEKDPVEILKYLMEEHNLKSQDLAKILNVSKGLVSGILNYKKGISKTNIRKLSNYFKLSQELFNQFYESATKRGGSKVKKEKVKVKESVLAYA